MPFSKMRAIKKKALQYGLKKARSNDPSADWIAREVFPGDDDGADFNDLDWKSTPAPTDYVGWLQDSSDLTADEYSSIFSTGERLNDDTVIIWYGLQDMSPQSTVDTRANTGGNAGRGALSSIRFNRGSSDIDIWGTEHLYTNENVVGFTDRVVQYLEKQDIDLQMRFTDDDSNKHIGLRGYLFEKAGKQMNPKTWTGGNYRTSTEWEWGVDPVQELTTKEIWQKKKDAKHNLIQKLMDMGVINSPSEAVVREVVFGDSANATDFVDLDYNTSATSGLTDQRIDSSDLTQDQFSSILATNEKVPENKAISFLGFWDKDTNPSLKKIRFRDGSSDKQVFEVEHCYGYRDDYIEGMFARPARYEEKEIIDPQFAFHDASIDHFTGLHGLIAERWGENISKE